MRHAATLGWAAREPSPKRLRAGAEKGGSGPVLGPVPDARRAAASTSSHHHGAHGVQGPAERVEDQAQHLKRHDAQERLVVTRQPEDDG